MYRLMIVDDELIERQALQFIITKNKLRIAEIQEAENGREAINKASKFLPHIILMDIKMPGINGIEASKIIKQSHPDCKIIFLTAFDYFEYAKDAIKVGVEDFIIKPSTNEQIIEVLNKVISHLDKEYIEKTHEKEFRDKLEQMTKCLQDDLVSSLVLGYTDEKYIMEYFSILDIHFKSDVAVAITIQNAFNDLDNRVFQDSMIKRRCIQKLKDCLGKYGLYSFINDVNNIIYILLIGAKEKEPEKKEKNIQRIFKEVYKVIEEELYVKIHIGIGNQFHSINQMNKSFLQAKIACKKAEHLMDVCSFNEIKYDKKYFKYSFEKEKILCEKIIQCEEKEVAMIIDEIIDLFVQFFDSMKEIHQKSYEFLISINKSIIQETNDEYDSMINFLDDFQYIESVPEIKNYMKENLKSIMEKISQSKMDRIGCLIERSCEYIEENYMKDITLEDMANKIGFSSYYFSKLFKIYKKMNFIDYLTSVRVKKAKSFLKEPNKSIKEISNLVGYSNSNYFTRVFKRIEKVTPTEYRNKIMLLGQ